MRSRDNNQLHGELSSSVTSDCEPFNENENKTVLPCGAIANSMFNGKWCSVCVSVRVAAKNMYHLQ